MSARQRRKVPGLLVISHGRLAEELVASARTILGDVDGMAAISIGWDDDADEARGRIEAAIRELDRGRGVLVLTDMFGGTPTNLALSAHDAGKIEIVTGVNLPMLIKFTGMRDGTDLASFSQAIAGQGREAIQVAGQLLGRDNDEGGDPA